MTKTAEKSIFHKGFFAMNTRFEVLFWGSSESVCNHAFQQIQFQVNKLEQTISFYDPRSELFNLNKQAANGRVCVSPDLLETFLLGIEAYKKSCAYFDISKGTDFARTKNNEQLSGSSQNNIDERVEIDKNNACIRYLNNTVAVDFGGMGKGLALKKAANIIDSESIEHAFVSFGESSILTRGHHPNGAYWPFALDTNFGIDKEWHLNNSSISISALLMRSTGQQHIIDPLNPQRPMRNMLALVQAANPADAEVLSTTLLAAPPKMKNIILQNFETENIFLAQLNNN
ncbi:MAG TPA: FAD:protein FMN transferase [Prolixibacteraceae bacterium]|nr:FAD:protein FMN transferase [Prolixibacteraceae bacterium]